MAQERHATEKHAYWYFGGIASVGAACTTHPLDLLKVALQTQTGHLSVVQLVAQIVREQGVLAFYNGLTASVLRQITYSTTRFGAYEIGHEYVDTSTFLGKMWLAGISGMLGGIMGTPADMINVRMQNDVKLAPEQRRNYKCGLSGIMEVYRHEGFTKLFSGVTTATTRGVFMTIGQIAFYEQIKGILLDTSYFEDNLFTHLTSSLMSATIATTLTQPMDVLKTREMNAAPGEYKGLWDVVRQTAKEGPLGFFKGYVPAFLRLGPQTIMTFVFLEQLRLNFGYVKKRQPTQQTSYMH